MGKGTSETTQQSQQTSQLTPYAPAASGLQGILAGLNPSIANINGTPQTNAAFGQLEANAQGPNPYAAPVQGAALSQLGGGANYGNATNTLNDAYGRASSALSPYTSGNAMDPSSNPALASQLATVNSGVMNSVNPMFSAAGRLGSPDNYQAVARGITQGSAPILQNAASNQLQATGMLGNLGTSTAGGLTSADLARAGIQGQGIGNASTAYGAQNLGPQQLLAASLAQQQLPIQNAQGLAGILGPLAGMFGTQTGSGSQTGTQTMSPLQQLLAGSQMFGNIFGGQGGGAAGNASKLLFG